MAEQQAASDPWGDFWGGMSDRVYRWLDWRIDDAMGMTPEQQAPTYYPESIPPVASNPVEPGFTLGNNPGTWGLGLGVVALVGLIAWSASK